MKTCYTVPVNTLLIGIADLVPLKESPGSYMLTRINVPRGHRGQGYGRQLLTQILEDADHSGATLHLECVASGGLEFDDLVAWYERHDFVRRRVTIAGQTGICWVREPQC